MPPTATATAAQTLVHKTHMPYRLDQGAGHRAAIGLVVLATDQTIEHEWRQLLDLEGVTFFVNRINSAATVNPDNLKAMEAELGKPVTSSCHAMAWHGLRSAGYQNRISDRGRLFRV